MRTHKSLVQLEMMYYCNLSSSVYFDTFYQLHLTSLWKYVNVRRLVLFLEETIEEGTQWVVFEPNDEKLWVCILR